MSEAATEKPVTETTDEKPTDAVEEVEKKPEVTEEEPVKEEVAEAPVEEVAEAPVEAVEAVEAVKAEVAGEAAAEKEIPATPATPVEETAEKEEPKVANDDASEDSESPKDGGDKTLAKELDDEAPKTFPQVVSNFVVRVAFVMGCDVKALSRASVGCLQDPT